MTLDELRQKYPDLYQGKNDAEMVYTLSQVTGASPVRVAYDMGLDPSGFAQNEGVLGDVATSLGLGVQNIPRGLAGLGDIAIGGLTGYTPLTDAVNWAYDKTGVNDLQDRWRATMSPETQAFEEEQRKNREAGNYGDFITNLATSPSQWLIGLAEMAPDMFVGGMLGRWLKGAKWANDTLLSKYGYAAGEGGISGGQSMNQMLAEGADPREAAALSLGSGTLVGLTGAAGAKLGNRIGVRDGEQSLAGYGADAGVRQLSYGKNLLAATGLEGGQELIQSPVEQIAQNVATDKPWHEGAGFAAIEGGILGGLMGGSFNLVPRRMAEPPPPPETETDLLGDTTTPETETDLLGDTTTPEGRQRVIDATMGADTSQTGLTSADPGNLAGLTRPQIDQRVAAAEAQRQQELAERLRIAETLKPRLAEEAVRRQAHENQQRIDALMRDEEVQTFAPGQYPPDVLAEEQRRLAATKPVNGSTAKPVQETPPEHPALVQLREAYKANPTLLPTTKGFLTPSGKIDYYLGKKLDEFVPRTANLTGEALIKVLEEEIKAKANLTQNYVPPYVTALSLWRDSEAKKEELAKIGQPVVADTSVPKPPTSAEADANTRSKSITTETKVEIPSASAAQAGETSSQPPGAAASTQANAVNGQPAPNNPPDVPAGPGVAGAAPAAQEVPPTASLDAPTQALLERAKAGQPLERFELVDLVDRLGPRVLAEDFGKTTSKWVQPREGESPEQTQARRDNLFARVVSMIHKRRGMGQFEGNTSISLDDLAFDFIERDEKGSPIQRNGKYVSLFDSARAASGTYSHQTLSNIIDKLEGKLRERGVPLPDVPKQTNKASKTKSAAGKTVSPDKIDGAARRAAISLALQSPAIKDKLDALAKPEKRAEFETLLLDALNQRYGPTPHGEPRSAGLGMLGKYQQARLAAAHVDTFNELDQQVRSDPVFLAAFKQNTGVDFAQLDLPAPGQTRQGPRFGRTNVEEVGGYDANAETAEDSTPTLSDGSDTNAQLIDSDGGRFHKVAHEESPDAELGFDDNVEGELDEDGAPIKGGSAAVGTRASTNTYRMWAKMGGYLPDIGEVVDPKAEEQPLARAKAELNALPANLKQTWIAATSGLRLKSLTQKQVEQLETLAQEIRAADIPGAQSLRGMDPGVGSTSLGESVKARAWTIGTSGMKNAPALADLDAEARDNFEIFYEALLLLPDAVREAQLKKHVPNIIEDYNARTRTESTAEGATDATGRPGGDAVASEQVAAEDGQAVGGGLAGDTAGTGRGEPDIVVGNKPALAADRIVTKPKRRVIPEGAKEGKTQQGVDGVDVKAENPTTVDRLRQTISKLLGKGEHWRLHIYQTLDEAIAAGHTPHKIGDAYGWVDVDKNGRKHAYFITERIEQGSELGKFLHEVGAHIGLENILTPANRKLLYEKIKEWATSGDPTSTEARIAREALARVEKAQEARERTGRKEDQYDMDDIIHETIAYFVEVAVDDYGVNPTALDAKTPLGAWFMRLWTDFKRALRRIRLENIDRMEAQDVVDLAFGAARMELKNPAALEDVSNRLLGDGKALRDLYDRLASKVVTFSQLEVPLKRSVLSGVFAASQDGEVFNSIVEAIPVEMMDVLRREQLTPEVFLHNDTVFFDLFPVDGNEPVAFSADVADAFVSAVAGVTAKQMGGDTTPGKVRYGIAAPKSAPTHVKALSGAVNQALEDAPTQTALAKLLGWMNIDQMAERFGTAVPLLKDIAKTFNSISAKNKHWMNRAENIVRMFDGLSKKQSELLGSIMGQARVGEFDPDKDTPSTPEHQDLVRQWRQLQALDSGAKVKAVNVYRAVRQHFADDLTESETYLKQLKAQAQGANDKTLDSLIKTLQSLRKRTKGPFFPLLRSGDHYVVAMSPQMKQLSDLRKAAIDGPGLSDADEKRYWAMRKDPKHYILRGADGEWAANRLARKFRSQGLLAEAKAGRNRPDALKSSIGKDMESFDAMLADLKLEPKVTNQLRNAYEELLIDALPENSPLKRQLAAEGISGWDQDMRRVFATASQTRAFALSRLLHQRQLQEQLAQLEAASHSFEPNAALARTLHNELMEHQALAYTRSEDPLWVRWATGFNYLSMLTMSPAFWFLNLMQVPTITAPWLAARNGNDWNGTIQGLAKAAGQSAKLIKWSFDREWRAELDLTNATSKEIGLTTGEEQLLLDMQDSGKLQFTITQDLGQVAEGRNDGMARVIRTLNAPTHATELINRTSTALAAYRISLKNHAGLKQNQGESVADFKARVHDAAVEFAIRATDTTQVNMDPSATARNMQVDPFFKSRNLARIMFQFWKFQQGMAYLSLSTLKDAINHPDPEIRKQARATAAGMSAMLVTTAGAFGLPFVGIGLSLASLAMGLDGDDDEDDDLERDAKNFLSDALPEPIAKFLTKGIWGLFDGPDFSPRFSMGNLMNPLAYARYDSGERGEDLLGQTLLRVFGGATGSSVAGFYDGLQAIQDGDFSKAGEKILPLKLLRDLAKTYSLSTDGVTTGKGEARLDPNDFSVMDPIWQAMGVQPMRKSRYYDQQAAIQGPKAAVETTRDKLLAKHAQARLQGKDVSSVTQEIMRFNQRNPHARIKADQLRQAVDRRRENRRMTTESGILANKQTKPYLPYGRWAE